MKKKSLVHNLTQQPQLFRAPSAQAPLNPAPGTMYPLNPPIAGPGNNYNSGKTYAECLLYSNEYIVWILDKLSA